MMQHTFSLRSFLVLSLATTLVVGCGKKDAAPRAGDSAVSTSTTGGSTTAAPTPKDSTAATTTATTGTAPQKIGDCPTKSELTYARSNTDPFTTGYKVDLASATKIVAVKTKEGQDLRVVFMNGDFDAKRVAEGMMTPINETQTGKFAVVVNFTNGGQPVVPGTYSPSAGYNKPFWVTAEIQVPKGKSGTACLVGANAGEAKILDMSNGKVCGSVNIKGKDAGVTGTFVADVIE